MLKVIGATSDAVTELFGICRRYIGMIYAGVVIGVAVTAAIAS